MRIFLVFLVVLLSGCSSIKTYEEIIESAIEDSQSDGITHQVNMWIPIKALDSTNLDDEQIKAAEKDKGLCVDGYRGVKFTDEALPVVYFMQCMNKKGWRLHTEEVIVIGH